MLGLRRKQKKTAAPQLILTDSEGNELYNDRLDAFPFPEEEIIRGSIEFYMDPAPCEIHRRAIQLRFCSELTMLLPPGKTLRMEDVPEFPRNYLGAMKPAYITLLTE